MAKIVYGVSGEESGHSSRAREMIKHLKQLGHTVKLVSYDRGHNNLKSDSTYSKPKVFILPVQTIAFQNLINERTGDPLP